MNQAQLIQAPFGINVFASAQLRVDPDIVSLHSTVSRVQQHPTDTFQEVRKYLEQAKVDDSREYEV
jgi:hypothetical protein